MFEGSSFTYCDRKAIPQWRNRAKKDQDCCEHAAKLAPTQ